MKIKLHTKYFFILLSVFIIFPMLIIAQDVNLKPDSLKYFNTDKKVNVAYGIQEGIEVTSSMSTVYWDELEKSTVATVGETLFGKLLGLTVQQNSFQPGSEPSIYIRGINTYGRNTPLVIVDGFRTNYNHLSIYEIESISVLKDAPATALYGQEAANGVLLVTTKRGRKGKMRLDLNFNYGFQQISQKPDLLNAREFATLYNQALTNDHLPTKYSSDDIAKYGVKGNEYSHPDNDYWDMVFNTFSPLINTGINLSGGNEKLIYRVTLGGLHNGGIYKNTDIQDYSTQAKVNRFNIRSNLDIKLTENLTTQVDVSGLVDSRNYPGVAAEEIISAIYSTPPQEYPIRNPDNTLGGSAVYRNNPIGLIAERGYQTLLLRNMDMTVRGQYKLSDYVEGLSLGVSGSVNNFLQLWDNKLKQFPVFSITSFDEDDYQYIRYGDETDLSWGTRAYSEKRLNFESNIKYDRNFEKSKLNAMLMWHYDNFETSDNHYKFTNAGLGSRVHYGYDDKYFAEFTAGYYGQEQYISGKRSGFFPAASLAWVASNEDLLNDNPYIDFLKFRLSYGKVGGQAFTGMTVHNRIFYKQYYSGAPNSSFGTTGQTSYMGRVEADYANPDITWDKSYKSNLGVEAEFVDHIRLMFDLYKDRRIDILTYNNKIPGTVGLNGQWQNGGEVLNKGYEAMLGFFGEREKFHFDLNLGLSYNKSEIVKKPDAVLYNYSYRSEIGKPVGQSFGYIVDGFWTEQSLSNMTVVPTLGPIQEGDFKYKDLNNDNIIDNNDMTAIGYSWMPEYNYFLNLNLQYGNFYLYVIGQGIRNSSIMLGGYYIPFGTQGNAFSYAKDSWTKETADKAIYPRLSTVSNSNNNQANDVWLKSRDYFKIRNVELGYILPQTVFGSDKTVKLYVRGQNLLTVAKEIDFVDPETLMGYPAMRTITLGFSLNY